MEKGIRKSIETLEKLADEIAGKESQLKTILDSLPVLVCVATPDYKFKKLNKRWEEVLGHPIECLECKSYLHWIHPEDITKTMEAADGLQRDDVNNFINRYRKVDGTYVTLGWEATTYNIGKESFAVAKVIEV